MWRGATSSGFCGDYLIPTQNLNQEKRRYVDLRVKVLDPVEYFLPLFEDPYKKENDEIKDGFFRIRVQDKYDYGLRTFLDNENIDYLSFLTNTCPVFYKKKEEVAEYYEYEKARRIKRLNQNKLDYFC